MCEIKIKNDAAIYILSKLYDGNDIQSFEGEKNIKIMKLIYLVYLKFIQQCDAYRIPDNSPLRTFKFYAWDYGGVERDIYENIGYIRSQVLERLKSKQTLNAINYGFLPDELQKISEAINDVKHFLCKTSEMLVELVHRLPEWGKTPKFELMLFANGFKEEIDALYRE